jgi:hypothetical protein
MNMMTRIDETVEKTWRGEQLSLPDLVPLQASKWSVIRKEELQILIWKKPAEHIGKEYGVSGRAVEEKCMKMGIKTHGRGYWSKVKSLTQETTKPLA